jgi:hypothetical protein
MSAREAVGWVLFGVLLVALVAAGFGLGWTAAVTS